MSGDGARDLLRRHGLRATAERVAVLEALQAASGHLTAAEVHDRVGGRVDLSTVYRALTRLYDSGVVHLLTLAEGSAYGVVARPHHHAVCRVCGRVIEVPTETLAPALERAGADSGWDLTGESVQLHGRCPTCR